MKIKITEILVGERQRDETFNCTDLVESFKQHGQIQPIVLDRATGLLIAGRRRLKAAQTLGWLEIEASYRDQVDEVTSKELELEENLCREGLSDTELVRALLKLHRLKVAKYGDGKTEGGWTLEATARTVSMSKTKAGLYMQVAEGLEKSPGVAKALVTNGVVEAYKVMKFEQEGEVLKELAKRQKPMSFSMPVLAAPRPEGSTEPAPAVAEQTVQLDDLLLLGDSLELVPKLKSEMFDIIFTDPPYGKALDGANFWGSATAGTVGFDDSSIATSAVLDALAPEFHRVLKPHGWFFLWTSFSYWDELVLIMTKAGFHVAKIPFIWCKPGQAAFPDPDHQFPNAIELGCYGWKGNPSMHNKRLGNFREEARVARNEKLYVFEKPIPMQAELLSNFVPPGANVLDPFSGTGSVFKSCLRTKMTCLSIEKDEALWSLAKISISDLLRTPVPSPKPAGPVVSERNILLEQMLLANGWTEAQLTRATDETMKRIMTEGLKPTECSVLPDGSVVVVQPGGQTA